MKSEDLLFLSAGEIKAFQEKKLAETLACVQARSPFYRELFAKEKIDVARIRHTEDLQQIPVTTKQELQTRNADFLCVPPAEVLDYVTTSGTLGEPVTFALTRSDLDRLALSEYLSYQICGCRESDVLQLMVTNDRCFMAGLASLLGSFRFGAGMIRSGNGIPELQWNLIQRIHPSVCVCVPSFILKLIEFARTRGIDYRSSSLRRAVCVGESLRRNEREYSILGERIHSLWPELSLHSNYASTEMQCSFMECEAQCGAHHKPDLTVVEFLDDSNRPVAPGEPGEITITTLGVEGMPVIRFKIGDVCCHYREPCACGRHSLRLGPVIGRKGQMIKYKGTTLYPPALYDVLDNIPEIKNYIVEVYTSTIGTDSISIRIGSACTSETFVKRIKDMFRSKIRVAPDIIFEPAELIAQKQAPPASRKLVKFFDYRKRK
jgi:phenylacetate-CoA ligase